MNSDLRNLKEGDWFWTIQCGWEKVVHIFPGLTYSVKGAVAHYTKDGKHREDSAAPSAFIEPPACFNPGPKPCDFVEGQRVLVRNSGGEWFRRYFHSMNPGVGYFCFAGGTTVWSRGNQLLTTWAECKAWEEGDE